MTKERSNRAQIRQVIAVVVTVLVLVPFAWLALRPGGISLVTACPPVDGTHLMLVAGETEQNDTRSWHDGFLVVLDAVHGRLVSKTALGTWYDDEDRPLCLGAARAGNAWMRRGDDPQMLEMRDARTGRISVSWEEILRRNPMLSVGVQALGWDVERAAPTMSLRDARTLILDAASLATSPYEGQVTLTPFGRHADEAVPSQSIVPFYVGGMPGLVLANGKRITLEGQARVRMVVDGAPLFGGRGRDFYNPALLVHPASGSVEWPDPPSVIVVEETLVGSLTYRVTRIALDGRELYAFDPRAALPAGFRYRPIPWVVAANGTRLVHFGELGVIAIDPATGRELYAIAYDGDSMARD